MTKAYDRRYFAFLGSLFFTAFLGFLGTTEYRHLAILAVPACICAVDIQRLVKQSPVQSPFAMTESFGAGWFRLT
ncbi:hypothetical protein K227x_16380 [Rubripirellula lacrimiformis]|uniref:Uncharacterized protein n=1 Tax=Rubripirellula lacrimiformis TaxID=1930273 RepID=A0A517N7Z1_9BACT|nr:hypothetical protein [Rubripirellula lacrimiformis]QDT03256.1 hypothetical protein K227x_16380 [Rubripirellula lacrimiformis]